MKRKHIRYLLLFISIVLLVMLYLNTNYFIKAQAWKHGDGRSVGDWIEFDDFLYSIKGRTIYKKGQPVGTVVFCYGEHLIIKELATEKRGYYVNKGKYP